MDINEIKNVMSGNDLKEKTFLLSHLCDVFESYNKNIIGLDEVIYLLIDYAITCDSNYLTLEILEAICKAQCFQKTDHLSFEKIAENINEQSDEVLASFIDILANTHDQQYIPIVLSFERHTNKYVQNAVDDAMIEMGILKSNL